jgi:chromosome segregation ATPase
LSNKIKVLLLTLLMGLVVSGCNNDLASEVEDYETEMKDIHELDDKLENDINSLDLKTLQESINNIDETLEPEDLDEPLQLLDDEILPDIQKLEEEISKIEVDNEEVNEVFSIFEENVSVKSDFVEELHEYLEAYQNSLLSNQQLIELSQSFMSNQEDRNDVIENAEGEQVSEEIDQVTDQVNDNSDALEEEAQILQTDESLEEKQEQIDDILLPMVDDHISELNKMNLETEDAIRVRSITLEMYYGFQQYYEERKKAMLYNNILQESQLQNILPMKETYEKLTDEYYKGLGDLKSEA